MRELRVQSSGRPLRVFHASDPRRTVVPLVSGDKTSYDRFYKCFAPLADKLHDNHLHELKGEGLIE